MRFKNITIPAEGRNKYGNYMSSSELQKSVVRVTYNGNNTTGGNDPKKPQEEQKDIYTLFLSRSTIKFESKKLLEGNVTENIDVLGFVNSFTGDTFVGIIDEIPTEDIEKNNDYYDIVGAAEKGMTISVANNGTKNTQIQITCTSAATENEVRAGTLVVPCSVYKKSGDIDLGPYIADWASEKDNCYTLYLEIQWEISALPSAGEKGDKGDPGRQGPALRGPVDWKNQVTSRRWCNGVLENPKYPEDAEFIDIVLYNDVYYMCVVSYEGTGSETTAPPSEYWKATDKQYEFVATNLLMAENAKINFQTSNELYLMDSNGNVTAGAAGGDGVNFWAGANEPGNGSFKVYNNGTMEATKGKFGLLEIGTDDLGNGILYGTNTKIDGGTNNISIQPQKFEMNVRDEGGNVSKSVTIAQDPDYMDDRGVVVVELNSAEDNGIYTNAMVEAEGYTKSINNHQFFTPFSPVNNLEITFVTDTNYFTKSNGFWVWRGMYLGRVSTTTYPYIIENTDGEWCFSPTNTQTSAGFVRSGIYTSKHIKQNNRLYIVI